MSGYPINKQSLVNSHIQSNYYFRGWQSFFANPIVRTWGVGIALGIVYIAYLTIVQFSTEHITGVDGHYHIRFASLMLTEGLKPNFPWLPLTILNAREFYDHHFLYHVALIPFSLLDLVLGAKLSAIIFATLAFLAIWWLLRSQNTPYSAIWALGLLAISEAFIYRMSLVRAQSLSLAVMAIGLNWMLEKKYARLLPLGFIYVWLYNAFPILLLFAAIYTLSVWVLESRLELRPLVYSALGISLGLLINPYFPTDLIFIFRHLLPKLTEPTAVDVGSEWYPYRTSQLLENSPLSLISILVGVVGLGLRGRRMDLRTLVAFLLAAMFALMLFQSRRFIEYFPPFALIFAAFSLSPLLNHKINDQQSLENNQEGPTSSSMLTNPSWRKPLMVLLMLSVILLGAAFTLRAVRGSVGDTRSSSLFAGASRWLIQNTPEGSRVFQTDWDDFPRLFFYNTHNTYLIGLDPTYMQIFNNELYTFWVQITQGEIEYPSGVIFDRFGARYVITDLSHRDFIRQAEKDVGLQEVFRDDNAIVYQLAPH